MVSSVKKICFTASTGGHFEQLMMLKPLMLKNDSFIVTEKTKYSVINNNNNNNNNIYYLEQINRQEKRFIFKMIINAIKSLMIFVKERPDVVISLGALATVPLCIYAKLFRKKLIFLESFAKVNSPTLTGKLVYKFADKFYVQWEEMKEFYPDAIYEGGIY